MDPIAILKLGARMISLGLISLVLLRLHAAAGARSVFHRLAPFTIFALWTTASVYWSPLKAVTAGHSVELILLVMLAAATGILTRSEARLSTLFRNLFLASFLISLLVLVLDREEILAGIRPATYMQPNALGSLAGCGLIVLIGCKILWEWEWTRKMFPYGVAVCSLALFAARSRTAIFSTLFVLIVVSWFLRRSFLLIGMVVLAGGLFAVAPYADTVAHLPDAVGTYLMRGESEQDLESATGRNELWTALLHSFWQSPIVGHGYYIPSSSGFLHAWGKERYQSAHNVTLHILTGTGIMGALFFLWGFLTALGPTFRKLIRIAEMRKIDLFVLMVVGSFLISGLFEISFLGPMSPDVVLFFTTFGVAAGHSRAVVAAPSRTRPLWGYRPRSAWNA